MWDWSPIRDWLSDTITPYWTFPLLTLVQAGIVTISLILCMAMYTYFERKVIGWMQVRRGPNRVGPLGLAQPFADVIKPAEAWDLVHYLRTLQINRKGPELKVWESTKEGAEAVHAEKASRGTPTGSGTD